jgi:alanine-glyoxylate transaminase/serine-glyoxylate transaminase/serine-pyruvate transaminase
LREALAELVDEGLEPLWERHANASKRLQKGVEAMGLELFVKDASLRLPTVTTIKVKEGLDWKAVTKHAMDK